MTFELPAGLRDRRGQMHLLGDQFVVVEPDGSVFALAASTGREMWRQNLGEPVHPAIVADRGDDERARGRLRAQPKLHRRGINSTETSQKIKLSGMPARR